MYMNGNLNKNDSLKIRILQKLIVLFSPCEYENAGF